MDAEKKGKYILSRKTGANLESNLRLKKAFFDLRNKREHGFIKLNDNIQYTIRLVSSLPHSITKSYDAYFELRNNWTQNKIYSEKEYKALVLDEKDYLICEITFAPKKTLKIDDIQQMLGVVVKHQPSKVFWAHNKPLNHEVVPSDNEFAQAKQFKHYSQKMNVPVVDQIILSDCECYSFADNGL